MKKGAAKGAEEKFVASRTPPTGRDGTALWLNSEN